MCRPAPTRVEGDASSERGHPLALALWALLRDRSVADKALVLNACDRRLGRPDMPQKQEQAAYAVSLFVEQFGHVPHASQWDAWRKADPSRCYLPSATFIRNAFGGWTGVRAALTTQPEPDVLTARLTARGPTFNDDDLLHVVRVWAGQSTGALRRGSLQVWLSSGGAADAGITRAPRHTAIFRRFGTFQQLLDAAGLAHRVRSRPDAGVGNDAAVGNEAAVRNDAGVGSDAGVANDAAFRSALLAELKAWSERVSGVLFQCDFLVHWQHLNLPPEHPLVEVPPLAAVLRNLLGSWGDALLAAGLSHRSARAQPGGALSTRPDLSQIRPRVMTEDVEELGRWLRLAAAEGPGAVLSYPQYDQWRKRRLEAAVAAGHRPEPIPSSMTLRKMAGGSWYAAKVHARVPGADEVAAGQRHRQAYARETVLEAVHAAMAANSDGPDSLGYLSPARYISWRAAQVAEQREAGREPHVPNIDLVRRVLGGPTRLWKVVVAAAVAEQSSLSTRRSRSTQMEAG
jgi:hypothetical protein